jgi:hypothetical protein
MQGKCAAPTFNHAWLLGLACLIVMVRPNHHRMLTSDINFKVNFAKTIQN